MIFSFFSEGFPGDGNGTVAPSPRCLLEPHSKCSSLLEIQSDARSHRSGQPWCAGQQMWPLLGPVGTCPRPEMGEDPQQPGQVDLPRIRRWELDFEAGLQHPDAGPRSSTRAVGGSPWWAGPTGCPDTLRAGGPTSAHPRRPDKKAGTGWLQTGDTRCDHSGDTAYDL